ncbi:MAG: hypothetical protein JM58_13850 [Peptococcaceae bacterium BICA1-8]|nr:MAG: hypothetical protein JM58_13850 [Peptococcaceae bacterium BICA1-8]
MNNTIKNEIEQLFNLKIIGEQQFPWGESYFLGLESNFKINDPDKPRRSVSIVTVYPDKEQKIHTHPGYEEVIYGLEGETIHWSNNSKIVLRKGQIGYISAGGQHVMLNISDKPAKLMSIAFPSFPENLGPISSIEDVELTELTKMTNLDAIAGKFAQNIKLGVSLVDINGSLLSKLKNFPKFCKICIKENAGDCVISPHGRGHVGNDLRMCKCKFGVYSVQSPIIINQRLLGFLGCGYGRISTVNYEDEQFIRKEFPQAILEKAVLEYKNLNFINRNHLTSVAEMLSLVSASLVQLIIQAAREKQLNSYKISLIKEKQRQAELLSSLNEAKLKLLESQVNPHFLFNTLNTIAQTAVMEGADSTATLTYALANLLRSSLGKNDSQISIRDEIDHIRDYIYIQKTRFPDRFNFSLEISPQIEEVKVPFMTLMVLVENSIIHGFSSIRWQGDLRVRGYKENNNVILEVIDNGIGVPNQVVEKVKRFSNQSYLTSSLKGLGLKNVYKRLEYYYGTNFNFEIERLPQKGTEVKVILRF